MCIRGFESCSQLLLADPHITMQLKDIIWNSDVLFVTLSLHALEFVHIQNHLIEICATRVFQSTCCCINVLNCCDCNNYIHFVTKVRTYTVYFCARKLLFRMFSLCQWYVFTTFEALQRDHPRSVKIKLIQRCTASNVKYYFISLQFTTM